MGAVYEAADSRLHNTVAVKHMTAQGPEANRAFEREASLLASLRHPALPVVIDHFTSTDGQFLVMQYIEGEDLGRVLRDALRCPPDEVLGWAIALLNALTYLHGRTPPVIHRDIKPTNIKRTPSGEVVLLDFGLAKGRLDPDATLARDEHSLVGFTLRYAPPEQIEGRGTDHRSDLYALGATLYHLLAGSPPPTALQRAAAAANGLPDPLIAASSQDLQPPKSMHAVLLRALALDPSDRFASADQMRSALVGGADTKPWMPRPADTSSTRRVDAAMPTQAEVGRQTDLRVQVRFAESPLLGPEDWPTRHRPTAVEQASEAVHVHHPVDPRTGAQLPARLRVRVVTTDFLVEGEPEHLIDVPPNEYLHAPRVPDDTPAHGPLPRERRGVRSRSRVPWSGPRRGRRGRARHRGACLSRGKPGAWRVRAATNRVRRPRFGRQDDTTNARPPPPHGRHRGETTVGGCRPRTCRHTGRPAST